MTNTAERSMQLGSHFHCFEVNAAAYGQRLNILAGTARGVHGGNALTSGERDAPSMKESALERARSGRLSGHRRMKMTRQQYTDVDGPTATEYG